MIGSTILAVNTLIHIMFDPFEDVRKKAVEIALDEATKDTREVGTKNRGERVDVYLRNAGALRKNAPDDKKGLGWCGMFIYFCYDEAANQLGKTLPDGFEEALWSGYKLGQWTKKRPARIVTDDLILPGDIYIMHGKNGNGHIGMAIEPIDDHKRIKTIDGNQSGADSGRNSVRKRVRSFHDMRLFIRI
jgi:hypothetical protein